ncbi:Staphylococcus haemolytic protein [Streptococcus pneumoniae]|nr:Staphylococcus haemolytic protein [Streptococcus pneumoniae]
MDTVTAAQAEDGAELAKSIVNIVANIARVNLLIVLLYKLFLSLFCNNEFKNYVYLHI